MVIFDKTGTLTYGRPELVDQVVVPEFDSLEVLSLVASAEQYSKHPLAKAVVEAGKKQGAAVYEVGRISEKPRRRTGGTSGRQRRPYHQPQAALSGTARRGVTTATRIRRAGMRGPRRREISGDVPLSRHAARRWGRICATPRIETQH